MTTSWLDCLTRAPDSSLCTRRHVAGGLVAGALVAGVPSAADGGPGKPTLTAGRPTATTLTFTVGCVGVVVGAQFLLAAVRAAVQTPAVQFRQSSDAVDGKTTLVLKLGINPAAASSPRLLHSSGKGRPAPECTNARPGS